MRHCDTCVAFCTEILNVFHCNLNRLIGLASVSEPEASIGLGLDLGLIALVHICVDWDPDVIKSEAVGILGRGESTLAGYGACTQLASLQASRLTRLREVRGF